MAKVLVGCPTYEGKAYILKQYALSVRAIDHDDYDILLIDNSPDEGYGERIRDLGLPVQRGEWHENVKERLVLARNMLRDHALEHGYDYFFSLEQDVIVDPQTLTRLLSHGKDFTTTVVMNYKVLDGKRMAVPMISVPWENNPGKLRYVRMAEIQQAELIEVAQAHLACTLLSRKILEQVPFRYDEGAYDDTCLCEDLLEKGVNLWCDTVLRPKHMPGRLS